MLIRCFSMCLMLLMVSGCAMTSSDPLNMSDSNYKVGEYSVVSVKVISHAPELSDAVAKDIEQTLKKRFQPYSGQKKKVSVEVTVHDFVSNIDTSQLMLAGGHYFASANIVLKNPRQKVVAREKTQVVDGTNAGGLLGVMIEGLGEEEKRFESLKSALIDNIVIKVYPQEKS